MTDTYANRLARIAESLPPGPCVVALVPTIAEAHAAGLASDVAQQVARGREGHTLLFSLEDAPSRLDHEIGVEEGEGLTDVIGGRLPLARAAASGRARGFIYVPAGREPRPGAELVRMAAWRTLVGSAVARGGTVLAFMPREVLEAARGGADEPTARIDGVVWLGPEPADVVWLPWRVCGSLDLPAGGAEPATGARSAEPGAGSPSGEEYDEMPPAEAASRSSSEGMTLLVRGASRRARRERERRRRRILVTAMIVAFLATLAIAAIALVGPDRSDAFLPENDTLWSSPADTAPASTDTAPVSSDTSGS